jgi:UrcA family protein
MTMKRPFASLIVAGCLSGSLAAGAATYDAPADAALGSTKVYFSHDELLDSAGLGRVYHRLRTAAREVCRYYDTRDLGRERAFQQCVAASLARAVAQIHDPGLTAYYEHRTGAIPSLAAALVASPGTVR